MIIKKHLPHRSSREGFLPDRIMLRFCREDASVREEASQTKNESIHWHLAEDGTVTEFLPLSSAATLPRGTEDGIPLSRRCIVILVQSEHGNLRDEQTAPLIRLLKRAQKEVFGSTVRRFPSATIHCFANKASPRRLFWQKAAVRSPNGDFIGSRRGSIAPCGMPRIIWSASEMQELQATSRR